MMIGLASSPCRTAPISSGVFVSSVRHHTVWLQMYGCLRRPPSFASRAASSSRDAMVCCRLRPQYSSSFTLATSAPNPPAPHLMRPSMLAPCPHCT